MAGLVGPPQAASQSSEKRMGSDRAARLRAWVLDAMLAPAFEKPGEDSMLYGIAPVAEALRQGRRELRRMYSKEGKSVPAPEDCPARGAQARGSGRGAQRP